MKMLKAISRASFQRSRCHTPERLRGLVVGFSGGSFSFDLKDFQPRLLIVKNASDLFGELLQMFKVFLNLGLATQVVPSSLVSCVHKDRPSESVGR
jgi:hypothetical protein